jgi:uroporphyrinogen decarboxylase
LHLHGSDVYFDLTTDYPIQVINWHDRETSYSLQDGLKHTNAVVCGGLRQWKTLALGTPQEIRAEGLDAIYKTGGKRFILGTGCVLPIIAPHGNILATRQVVES